MRKIILFAVLAIFCVAFWNALHFIYTVWISGDAYSFSLFKDVCLPAVIGVTVGMLTNARQGGR